MRNLISICVALFVPMLPPVLQQQLEPKPVQHQMDCGPNGWQCGDSQISRTLPNAPDLSAPTLEETITPDGHYRMVFDAPANDWRCSYTGSYSTADTALIFTCVRVHEERINDQRAAGKWVESKTIGGVRLFYYVTPSGLYCGDVANTQGESRWIAEIKDTKLNYWDTQAAAQANVEQACKEEK